MKTYGVGIVGTGWVSDEYIKAFEKNGKCRVIGLCSRSQERARNKISEQRLSECSAFTDLSEMLVMPDLEVVVICTPHHLHVEQGVACARAGKHLVVEKPVAIHVPGLRLLDKEIRQAGVRSIVSFVLRWNPMFDNIRAMLARKVIGQIFYAEVDYMHGVGPSYRIWEWMRKTEFGGSAILAGGSHAVDGLRWFVQDKAVEVTAYSNYSKSNPFQYEYPPNTVTIVRFAGGAIGKVACSLECRMPYVFNVELFGDKGSIRNNRVFTTELPGLNDWATIPSVLPDSGDVSHHPFQQEINHFIECIENGVESHANVADAVETHEICLAADLSAAERRPVQLPLP
ncbi:MAG: Gfo/Idh/MocA family oxidoreductase [Acidobacteria bacterium]|nr:Gfo/Idh/MocA family oxidoreductase [Acidobacteriota bacterium]